MYLRIHTLPLTCLAIPAMAQTLVDSIPYPALSQGFWGIHVTADTIFLGADFSGNIYFSDHAGNILGQQATGLDFNHGLVRKEASYLIAEDYATNGASLFEVSLDGTMLNEWAFPDVIGGPSSGIGAICADGDAIWYTMYYPDFDTYPFAYAYKWTPGEAIPADTVPLQGEQPYGLALRGDTLYYVTDNLNGDPERIHSYDLVNEQDLGYVDLPDMATDGDQSPRGLFRHGNFLYLVANRSGGSAFAYQTVFIYALDGSIGFRESNGGADLFTLAPNPADGSAVLELDDPQARVQVLTAAGQRMILPAAIEDRIVLPTVDWPAGVYVVSVERSSGDRSMRRLVVQH